MTVNIAEKITARIDAITRIPPAYQAPVTPCPRSVKIELTGKCNFACTFCARSGRWTKSSIIQRTAFFFLHRESMSSITSRIDRITLLTDEYRSEAPPAPRSVKIELTARCDFQCFFCARDARSRHRGDRAVLSRRVVHV